jgi:phosphoglycerate dehydrogenase-like enzyme
MTTQKIEFGVRSGETRALRLGIVGAGKLGTTVARAAIAAGYDVAMSGSGTADRIALTVDVLAPGARAVTTREVVRHADLIVLAVPTHRSRPATRSYDGVSRYGAANLARLEEGAMPCDGPRPADQVDAFRRSIAGEARD